MFIGLHRPTGSKYAVKQVDRSKMMWGQRDALKDEIENLQNSLSDVNEELSQKNLQIEKFTQKSSENKGMVQNLTYKNQELVKV